MQACSLARQDNAGVGGMDPGRRQSLVRPGTGEQRAELSVRPHGGASPRFFLPHEPAAREPRHHRRRCGRRQQTARDQMTDLQGLLRGWGQPGHVQERRPQVRCPPLPTEMPSADVSRRLAKGTQRPGTSESCSYRLPNSSYRWGRATAGAQVMTVWSRRDDPGRSRWSLPTATVPGCGSLASCGATPAPATTAHRAPPRRWPHGAPWSAGPHPGPPAGRYGDDSTTLSMRRVAPT